MLGLSSFIAWRYVNQVQIVGFEHAPHPLPFPDSRFAGELRQHRTSSLNRGFWIPLNSYAKRSPLLVNGKSEVVDKSTVATRNPQN
jgi:hypothetical protein